MYDQLICLNFVLCFLLVHLNKNAFKWHLCHTATIYCKTELVEPPVSFEKEMATQVIKYIRNIRVSCIPTFNKSSTLNFITVVLLVWGVVVVRLSVHVHFNLALLPRDS